jgi:hypothetical protein
MIVIEALSRSDEDGALGDRALALVLRLHREGILSEGQCCRELDLDRVTFRILADAVHERTRSVSFRPSEDQSNTPGQLEDALPQGREINRA